MSAIRPSLGFKKLFGIIFAVMWCGLAIYFYAGTRDKKDNDLPIAAAVPKAEVIAATSPSAAPKPVVPDKIPAPAPTPVVATSAPATTAAPVAAPPPADKGSFTLDDLKAQVPRDPSGNFLLELPEIFMAAGDKQLAQVLEGQPVSTVARVLPEKVDNTDGKRVRLFGLVISCCAADAQPVTIGVEFPKKAPEFKEMTWVKVRGTMHYPEKDGRLRPLVNAIEMVETDPPDGNKSLY